VFPCVIHTWTSRTTYGEHIALPHRIAATCESIMLSLVKSDLSGEETNPLQFLRNYAPAGPRTDLCSEQV
jgi:hypothetical protein